MNCEESNLQGITSMIRCISIEKYPLFNDNYKILLTDTHKYKFRASNPKVVKVPVFFQSEMTKEK